MAAKIIVLTAKNSNLKLAFNVDNIVMIEDVRTDPALANNKDWDYTIIQTTSSAGVSVKETLAEILEKMG